MPAKKRLNCVKRSRIWNRRKKYISFILQKIEMDCEINKKYLRSVQVYSHTPFIAVGFMLMIMLYRSYYFTKGFSGMYVIGSMLALTLPSIAISMIYHDREIPAAWGDADSIMSTSLIFFILGILAYYWHRIGFKKSFSVHQCLPYLTGALVFCFGYMFSLYSMAYKAYDKELLVYHMNHVQWHVLGSVSFFLSMLILYLFLHQEYNQ